MTTVSKDPVPPKDIPAVSHIVSDSNGGSAGYARPTAGGNAAGKDVAGNPVDAPPGRVPASSINMAGNPPEGTPQAILKTITEDSGQ